MSLSPRAQSSPNSVHVPCVVLDAFVPTCAPSIPVGLVKIDVQGYELPVLKGFAQHIEQDRPFIYVEADRKDTSESIMAWLLARDYELWWHVPPLFNLDNVRGAPNSEVAGNACSINVLAAHRSKNVHAEGLERILAPCVHPWLT